MFLALKGFNQAAIYLSLASVPPRTSFPCVLEEGGKIDVTILQRPGRAGQPVNTRFCHQWLIETLAHCVCREVGQEDWKVVIRTPKWKKVRLANAEDIGQKAYKIYIGLAGERLCDHCNNSFLAYEHLIYKNIDSTSLDKID